MKPLIWKAVEGALETFAPAAIEGVANLLRSQGFDLGPMPRDLRSDLEANTAAGLAEIERRRQDMRVRDARVDTVPAPPPAFDDEEDGA